ncbi:MAG: hypothetical protein NC123_02795 [Butyrivibrio sp.]|nr:hypothetical protein [Acetatifactor muris]MCM1558469.1 hypothetical protein [Butyrivibrio sp.]
MAKCKSGKCGCRARIVSSMVQNMQGNCCTDVCSTPIYGSPEMLSIMAPVIYDEIGINLCATFPLGTDVSTAYPGAVSATAQVVNIAYDYGDTNVEIAQIAGRPNCYVVTLANLSVTFAVKLYDENCRLLGTIYPVADYLPADTAATYDEDTNPSSVELEIFAPYGVSYTAGATAADLTPVLNYLGFESANNSVRQGLNFYGIGKALNFDTDDDTITVGLTLILQSIYYAGYSLANAARINTPKGSLVTPDNTSCLQFVAGDLLDLAIKPLELGPPKCEELLKESCGRTVCGTGAVDDTILTTTTPTTPAAPATQATPTTDATA